MCRPTLAAPVLVVLAAGLAFPPTATGQGLEDVEIEVVPVADGVHMLVGRGGNIGVSSGDDGVFLVDDQYAPLTGRIREDVRTFADGPIRFVLNTHWHGDHTGGNENLGEAGALLVAHENVRERLSSRQVLERWGTADSVPPAPEEALPVVTFTRDVTFHLNGDRLRAVHVPRAHTDGDVIIHFRDADVIHMGDTFFSAYYPFIDLSSGGSVDGAIRAAERALEIAGPGTRIIPGHGPLADAARLRAYREMLVAVRDRIAGLVAEGRSLEEVQAAAPTASFDAEWGGSSFVTPDRFVETVYRDLSGG